MSTCGQDSSGAQAPDRQTADRPTAGLLVLIGASGFGREILWVCRRAGWKVAGFCDDAAERQAGTFCELPLLGPVEQAAVRLGAGTQFHIAVGDNRARQRLSERALAVGWQPAAIIDPSAVVAADAQLGAGTYVGIGSVVSCRSELGRFVIVNHQVTVGHDSRIGDFAQLCPGVRVSGGCALGVGAFLGSNAVVIPQRAMGAWAMLGAGAIAMRDVAEGEVRVRLPGVGS